MNKIEPMSVDRLKEYLTDWLRDPAYAIELELALSWIHAEARARKSEAWMAWIMNNKEGSSPSMAHEWIAAVKKEVGWDD